MNLNFEKTTGKYELKRDDKDVMLVLEGSVFDGIRDSEIKTGNSKFTASAMKVELTPDALSIVMEANREIDTLVQRADSHRESFATLVHNGDCVFLKVDRKGKQFAIKDKRDGKDKPMYINQLPNMFRGRFYVIASRIKRGAKPVEHGENYYRWFVDLKLIGVHVVETLTEDDNVFEIPGF